MKMSLKNIFKKSIWILAATFLFFGMLFLFSCGKKQEGVFTQDELPPLSIGDRVDLMEYFDPRQSADFSFHSNDENVFAEVNGAWTAVSGGYTYVYAISEGKQIDSINVFVKSRFSTPTNITVSESGLIEWDKVFLLELGNTVNAHYEICINGGEPIPCEYNFYQLNTEGDFDVQVRAIGNETIDSSKFSEPKTVYYNAMRRLEDLSFEADAEGGFGGTLSWTDTNENADYEVLINNVVQNLTFTNGEKISCTVQLQNVRPGAEVKFQVIAKDRTQKKRSTISEISSTKLQSPSLEYADGKFSWDAIEGAKEYKVFFKKENSEEILSSKTAETTSNLFEMESGENYEFGLQPLAENGKINGNIIWYENKIVKLQAPTASGAAQDKKLILTISNPDAYPNRYLVKYGNEELLAQNEITRDGELYIMEVEIEGILPGDYTFEVQALPRLNANGEVELYNGAEVISSDFVQAFRLVALDSANEIAHSLNENNESILTFENIPNATKFEVFVNDLPLELSDDAVVIGDITTINIGQLSKDQTQIVIKIKALRADDVLTIYSESEKPLTVLDNPEMLKKDGTLLGNVDRETNNYSWQAVENATYEYCLIKTNATFSTAGIEEEWIAVSENILSGIAEGYYVLRVRSVSGDINNYLSSDGYAEDKFFITKQLDPTDLSLGYGDLGTGNAYYLSADAVENGYFYDINFGGEINTITSSGNAVCILNDELFNDLSAHTFKVRVRGRDATIYLTSKYSEEITIQKLAAPQVNEVSTEEVATIELPTGAESLQIPINGLNGTNAEAITYSQTAEIDLSNMDGDISVHIFALGLTKESLSQPMKAQEFYLQSETAILKFHRSDPPTNLTYNHGIISFNHTDKAESYLIALTLTTVNSEEDPQTIELAADVFEYNLKKALGEKFNSLVSFKMSISAKISSAIDGVYYLSSRESSQVEVDRLNAITSLQFDKANKKLKWQDSQGATYYVYLNGEKIDETTNKELPIEFLNAGENSIYVIATKEGKIDSQKSNEIVLDQLKSVDKITLGYNKPENGQVGSYFATFDISGFQSHISEIVVSNNGASTTIAKENLPAGNIIKVENIAGDLQVEIKGASSITVGEKTYYYIDSISRFGLSKISAEEGSYSASISDGKVIWNYPIEAEYEILIYQGDKFIKSKVVSDSEISLDNKFFTDLGNNSYTIAINAVAKAKEVQNGSSGVFGTQTISNDVQVVRFEAVSELSTTYGLGITTAQAETEKPIVLSWNWTKPSNANSSNIVFNIFVGENLVGSIDYDADGTGSYGFELSTKLLQAGTNEVKVVVSGEKDIPASSESIEIIKYQTPTIAISDDGLIDITTANQPASKVEKYIVDIVKERIIVKTIVIDATNGNVKKSIALKDTLNADYFGEYTFNVVAQGLSGGINATSEIGSTTKTILAQPGYENEGKIIFTSTDAGVDFTINSINGQSIAEELQPKNGEFFFPDDWAEGEYTFVVIASKKDAISSCPKELNITLTRVTAVSAVNIVKEENGETRLSWEKKEGVQSYTISVSANGELLGRIENFTASSLTISELEEFIGVLPAGAISFSIVAFGQSTNSQQVLQSVKFNFSLTKLSNNISGFQADEIGMLVWSDSAENHTGYDLTIKQGESTERKTFGKDVRTWEPDLNAGEYSLNIRRTGNVGNTAMSITAETSEIVYIDSNYLASGYVARVNEVVIPAKTYLFSANAGEMEFITENIDENLKIFIVYNNQTFNMTPFILQNGSLSFRVADIMELINAETTTNLSFKVYTTIGTLKSKDSQFTLNQFSTKVGFEISRQNLADIEEASFEDIMSYTDYFGGDLSNLIIRVKDVSRDKTAYKLFSGVSIATDFASSSKVHYLLNSLGLAEPGEYKISISFGKSGVNGAYSQSAWSEEITVNRLSPVSAVYNTNGNITWADNGRTDDIYGYIVYAQNVADSNDVFLKIYQKDEQKFLDASLLRAGKKYNIYVVAVSKEANKVISAKTFLMDGTSPAKVQRALPSGKMVLKDGSLSLTWGESTYVDGMSEAQAFATDNFLTVLDAYKTTDNKNDFASKLISYQFVNPISFNVRTLNETYLQLIFKSKNADGTENSTFVSVPATQLLQKLPSSYLNILWRIADDTQSNTLKDFYNTLRDDTLFTGVANQYLIFDDMGHYTGENIQAGAYEIALKQTNTTNSNTILNSDEISSNLGELQVQQAPTAGTSVSESQNFSDGIGTYNLYYLTFTPLADVYDYTLVLRDKEFGQVYAFSINKATGTWSLNNLALTEKDGMVNILLNSKQDSVGLDSLIEDGAYGRQFSANIYANGDSTSLINGKSNNITVNFMGMNPFKVVEGELEWKTYTLNGSRISARVETKSSVVITTRGNEITRYFPEEGGVTGTVKITTSGSRSTYSMNVESQTYIFSGTETCFEPTLSIVSGNIQITNNVNNPNSAQYRVYNNQAQLNSQSFLTSVITGRNYLYQPGVNYYNGDPNDMNTLTKETEKRAETFYVYNIGLKQLAAQDITYNPNVVGGVVNIQSSQIIFRSKAAALNAKMIQEPTGLTINAEGDFTWNEAVAATGETFNADQQIKYDVDVYYYTMSQNSLGIEVFSEVRVDHFTTESNVLEKERIHIFNDDKTYYYRFTVRAYASDTSTYTNGAYILTSEVAFLPAKDGDPMARLSSPTGFRADRGEIVWNYSGADEGTKFELTYRRMGSEEILPLAIVEVESKRDAFTFKESSNAFAPNTSYEIFIQVMKEGCMPSNKVSIQNVIKLHNITESHIEVSDSEAGGEIISLSSYFESVNAQIRGNAKVQVSIGEENLFTLNRLSSDFSVVIDSIMVQDGEYFVDIGTRTIYLQNATTALKLKFWAKADGGNLLNSSNAFEKTFQKISADVITELSWNEDLKSFTWTLDESAPSNKIFDVEVLTVQTWEEGISTIKQYETRQYFGLSQTSFSPTLMGNIIGFRVRIRTGTADLASEWQELSGLDENSIAFYTFAGGDGTKNNPYLISNVEQFRLIVTKLEKPASTKSYKQIIYKEIITGSSIQTTSPVYASITEEDKYYFKQTEDIVIGSEAERENDFVISGTFSGAYDGNGKSISFFAEGLQNIDAVQISMLSRTNSASTITFEAGLSLFKEVSALGEIKNLNINFNYLYATNTSAGIASGLTLKNSGKIENVRETEFTASFNGSFAARTIAIAGLVGINRGTMIACVQDCGEANIESTERNNSARLYIAGVAFTNYEKMTNCGNFANIKVNLSNAQDSAVQLAGVAIGNLRYNNSTANMQWCYNKGNLSANNAAGTAFVGGIVALSNSGSTVEYCFNTGNISSSTAGGVASIAVSLMQSTISNVVCLGGNSEGKIAANESPRSATNVYRGLNYISSLSGNIINQSFELSNAGYRMIITYNSAEDYDVDILTV